VRRAELIMKIIRVFPRKTIATPTDENVRFSVPSLFDGCDQVNISVSFTYDMKQAEYLYSQWKYVAPVTMGGAAITKEEGNFIKGMYLKEGYTITSRGCNNKCWFCIVWKKQPFVKELPIVEGNIIQDDNLLACSDQHIINVFEMLKKQKKPIIFSGGIEAKLLKKWHIDLLKSIKLSELFCAYDTPDDLEPLFEAGKLLTEANITLKNRKARCYVLIGYPSDTFEQAEKRLHQTIDAGFFPFAMLWRNKEGECKKDWKQFQRQWANNTIIAVKVKEYL
jgi:hypothetical protein